MEKRRGEPEAMCAVRAVFHVRKYSVEAFFMKTYENYWKLVYHWFRNFKNFKYTLLKSCALVSKGNYINWAGQKTSCSLKNCRICWGYSSWLPSTVDSTKVKKRCSVHIMRIIMPKESQDCGFSSRGTKNSGEMIEICFEMNSNENCWTIIIIIISRWIFGLFLLTNCNNWSCGLLSSKSFWFKDSTTSKSWSGEAASNQGLQIWRSNPKMDEQYWKLWHNVSLDPRLIHVGAWLYCNTRMYRLVTSCLFFFSVRVETSKFVASPQQVAATI